ncbi:alkaline phosphatase family protein [Mycolicibacterium vanbaalenii]|uniref:alkaline phosphatase family protein n=1 Tax=Mycolicibacterium vanbaalenii TaxID=110539 RepID=UPI001F3F511F|nr:alkaline phosphatase family protein [Mycolicibacterium vanbaalenii]UJL27680.1 alkaline phosphatase family protein [Mycolicibacterium vanbaalenii]WND54364.1 alkaline phosphatase family protein [Mycolicibacterium vanbaalenii]
MGYSNHIGRVGALAVTLGVGWAVASASGVAHAEPSAPSASSESSSTTAASNEESSAKVGTSADDGAAAPDDEAEKEVVEADDEEVVDEDDVAEAEDAEAQDVEAEDVEAEDTVSIDVDDAEGAEAAVVTLVSDQVTSEPAPRPEPVPAAPMEGSAMLASLAAVRDELERNAIRRSTVATQITALADETPNVLVIGVDGTNLSRVLTNPTTTTNFFSLIQNGTTAASTIVGHTTISNPSWSSILTGAWGEKTGVINNIFTPWTYEKWPTVFTQLETLDGSIVTTSIANWNVISGIADSGLGADTVVNVSQVEGDTNWLLTDDEVGDLTEAAIATASSDAANFMFSYFVGVDENGHLYGGDSPEYAAAVANFDRNLGEILQAVSTWEAATGEKWTIIMVTDHGHQAQKGLGHGFQSPDETSTFVIASNPELFGQGVINLKYSIVDVTPTVLSLFGFEPAEDADGVPLTELDDADVTPVDNDAALRGALLDIIGKYGYPDIGTTLALGARTIFASVPYYVDMLTTGITGSLQTIADAGIFLISPLAQLAIVPVKFVGDLAYVATNFVAQIVARLTGVTGASIFPLWPPAPPTFPESPEELSTPDLVALVCSDGRVSSAVFACGAAAVAV